MPARNDIKGMMVHFSYRKNKQTRDSWLPVSNMLVVSLLYQY